MIELLLEFADAHPIFSFLFLVLLFNLPVSIIRALKGIDDE